VQCLGYKSPARQWQGFFGFFVAILFHPCQIKKSERRATHIEEKVKYEKVK